ncbi:hypothetical protein ACFQQB_40660 [Nonomuraea rubra]|uniref:hypothetical protein n=1 Tax=Nonomuraea rubra TaxID=46180 RepID=UPI003618E0AF
MRAATAVRHDRPHGLRGADPRGDGHPVRGLGLLPPPRPRHRRGRAALGLRAPGPRAPANRRLPPRPGNGRRRAAVRPGPLPPRTAATEGYAPNLPIARARLEPLGVEVAESTHAFPDASFDLVLNRHAPYDPAEVRRLLAPGGRYLTQQVSGRDLEELNAALGGPRTRTGPGTSPRPRRRSA